MKNNKINSGSRPQIERFNQIALAIKERDYPNAVTLARDFCVDPQTIRRDIIFMRDRLGYPIDFDRRKNGYYFTGEFTPIGTQNVSQSEVEGLCLLESASQILHGTSAEADVKSAFKKVMASLSHDKAVYPKHWRNIIHFRSTVQNIFVPQVFHTIFKAAARRQQLKIIYRKPGPGQVAEVRIIDPYIMVRNDAEWFIFAYDHGRKDFRTFVPARVKSISKTGKKFSRRKDFCIEERLRNSFNIHGGGNLQDVRIEFSPRVADHIREKRWGGQQGLRELDNGGVELHLRLSTLVEVHRWILNWGGDAIPTYPQQLHEMLTASAHKMLEESQKRNAPQMKAA